MDKNLENMQEERTDQIKKEILDAIEAYNKAVKKKKYDEWKRGLTFFMGRCGPADNDEEDTEDDGNE